MTRTILAISSVMTASTSLFCYEWVSDYSFVDKSHPVHVEGEFRNVANARFYTPSVKGSHTHYQDAYADLYYSFCLSEDNALTAKVGYSFLNFDWKDNPRFTGHDYQFMNASLAWVSHSVPDWKWILLAGASIDAQEWNMGTTGVYEGLMWGRYHFSDVLGMHVGWAGYVGVRNGYLLPILGIDVKAGSHWKFNAIFPLNGSIEYQFNPALSAELAFATFNRPYRFPIRARGGIDGFEDGIFQIYSKGLELDLNGTLFKHLSLGAGVGWNFGGWILIKDHHNHRGAYYKYNGALYAQGRLAFTF